MSRKPRWLSPYPKTSRGDECIDFIQTFCRCTEDSVGAKAGDPIVLRGWQKQLIRALLATEGDKLLHRKALIGMARKNGKTVLMAGVVLWALAMGPMGGQIFSVASTRQQARLVFATAKRMVEQDEELAGMLEVYQYRIVNPVTNSFYEYRSADAPSSHGLNPVLVIYDEVHAAPDRDLWDAMDTARGAREESILIGITTAGARVDTHGNDTICFELYQYGRRVATGELNDPSFFMAWWEAPEGADVDDPETWRQANPGYGDINREAEFTTNRGSMPEPVFRTYHVNQWVNSWSSWLPNGAWEACQSDREIEPGTPCVFGFDGSLSSDCTAVVMATIEERPHVKLLGLWEPYLDEFHGYVDVDEVKQFLRDAYYEWRPREIVADTSKWRNYLEELANEGLPIVELTQSSEQMRLANQGMFEAVVHQDVTHDGDPKLARHFENCTTDSSGRVKKENASSNRKIDAAIAANMARHRARFLFIEPEPIVGDANARWNEMTPEQRQAMVDEHNEHMRQLIEEEKERRRQLARV